MTETGMEKRRLEVAAVTQGDDDTCRTFIIHEEDHTLGNALRYMVQKNPDVAFCGYSVPHPSENKINFRIQTKEKSASACLRQGLEDLEKLCQHILKKFQGSVEVASSQKSVQDSQNESQEGMDTS